VNGVSRTPRSVVTIMTGEDRQAPGTMGPLPPMVGRSAERVLLREQLADVEAGHGQLGIIGGEAGIGKTTLVRDLVSRARAKHLPVIVGQCYDLMATPPYGLWLDLASSYQGAGDGASRPSVPPVLASRDLHGITSQAEVFDQVRSFLGAVAAGQPTLVVLEDVHWADPVSLELLRHIASHLERVPLLLVVTYRVDELTRQNPFYRHLPALIRESGGLRIDLKRLTRDDLSTLVTTRYALPAPDEARLVSYLEEHSDGNPFFAIELLRALEDQERDGLWRSSDGWVLAGLDTFVVPALVRQVIDARLERLGEATREPLAVAAVIGQEVALDLWAGVAGLDADALLAIIDTAVHWHVLTATSDGTRIRFVHALTREALYESILPPRRRLLHRAVADTLAERSHEREIDPDAVAYHLQQAGDPRAPEWLIRAGERAQRAYAWLTARDRFAAAADALADVPGEELARARLLYRCGRLQRYSNAAHGIESLRLASRLAELAGDRVLTAEAIYSRGLLHCFADAWDPGVGEMADGIARMEALPENEGRDSWSTVNWLADALPMIDLAVSAGVDPAADTLTAVGINHRRGSLPWFLATSGRAAEARAMAETFLGHVEGIDVGPLVLSNTGHAAFGLGMAHAALGDPRNARMAFARAREIYERLDHHAVIAFVFLTELQDVMMRYFATDLAGRQRCADEGQAALERAGGAFLSDISFRRAQVPVMWIDGRWSEAREIAGDSVLHGHYVLRRQVTNALAPIAYHQGCREEAWGHVTSLLAEGPATSPGTAVLHDALMLQQLAADLALDDGDRELARAWLEANDRWLAWSGSVAERAGNALAWARFDMIAGDLASASGHADRAMDAARHPMQPLAVLAAHRLRGSLAMAGGDLRAAERELRAALALADACAAPFERARTLVAMAELSLHAGLPDATALLQEGRAICENLRAQLTLERIDALLGQATNAPSLPSGLTSRELDVLRLAAQGLTDAEIGERLFISPRTASQHLRSIYGKLGVRSRAGATRFAIEHHLS
jgi:DNA-binding CsgD family transcriptional regulator/tetratricopeptide (TPR) repeat protein